MGWHFRKSFKIVRGVKINIGKNGVSSVSIGGRGTRLTIGKKKTTTTVGIPNTGLSYSTSTPHQFTASNHIYNSPVNNSMQIQPPLRRLSLLLLIGIIFIPYIFAWFTLRKGYSSLTRLLCFGWLILFFILK